MTRTTVRIDRRAGSKWQCRVRKGGHTAAASFRTVFNGISRWPNLAEIKSGGELTVHYHAPGVDGELTNSASFQNTQELMRYIRMFTEADLIRSLSSITGA